MTKKKERLLIIDSNSLIHRAFHALPLLTTKKGELINALYGFLLVFLKVIREFKPDYIIAAFDFPALTFRHKEYKEYKAKRPPIARELAEQITKVKNILKVFNVPIFEKEGFEADDIIGSIPKLISSSKKPEIEVIVLTGDLDLLQAINENTKVFILKRGIKDAILYNREKFKEKYGINPSQLVDLKALKGDASDNIPGVPGIGEKTAIELIKKFDSLENLYKEIEKNTDEAKKIKPAVKEKLINYRDQAFLSKNLSQIKKDVSLDIDLKKCRWGRFNKRKVIETFKRLEFYTLIKRFSD